MSGRYRYANNITLTNRYTRIGKTTLRDVELKYFDTTHDVAATSSNVNNNPIIGMGPEATSRKVVQLNLVPAGNLPSERIGRKIVVKEIAGNIIFTMNAHQSDVVKVSVVQDRQCNGAELTADSVFTGTRLVDFPQLANSQRYNILAMKMKSINWTGLGDDNGPANGETRAVMSFKIPCNIEINFSDAAGAIASVRSNNLCVIFQSRDGKTKAESRWRIRYSDI